MLIYSSKVDHASPYPDFYVSVDELNSGPYLCMASPLPTKPPSQSLFFLLPIIHSPEF